MSDQTDDRELLHRCIDGDRRAWETFVVRFSKYVYYLIHVTARKHGANINEEEASDLHNDLFVALLEDDRRRLRAFKGSNGCSVRSWVRVITIRRCIDALRKRRKTISIHESDDGTQGVQLVDESENPFENLVAAETAQRHGQLERLTDELAPNDRLLLEMLYIHKMGADAISAALKIKKGAVYTRKTRLIQRLQTLAARAGLTGD